MEKNRVASLLRCQASAMDPFAIFRGDGPQAHEEPVIADAVKGGVSPQSRGGIGADRHQAKGSFQGRSCASPTS
jgi:hypothetical protein